LFLSGANMAINAEKGRVADVSLCKRTVCHKQ
jgi:hypothetical protein